MARRVVYVQRGRLPRGARGGGKASTAVGVMLVAVAAFTAVSDRHHHPAATAAAGRPQTASVIRPGQQPVARAIAYARDQLGKPYVYGGPTLPGTGAGFDCSGLVMEAWNAAGVNLPRTSEQQWAALPHVSRDQLQPGDLVFERGGDVALDPPPGHVYLYIGHGHGIEAYAAGVPVRIITVRWSDATGYARPGR